MLLIINELAHYICKEVYERKMRMVTQKKPTIWSPGTESRVEQGTTKGKNDFLYQ